MRRERIWSDKHKRIDDHYYYYYYYARVERYTYEDSREYNNKYAKKCITQLCTIRSPMIGHVSALQLSSVPKNQNGDLFGKYRRLVKSRIFTCCDITVKWYTTRR